jgi:hypothetical protein
MLSVIRSAFCAQRGILFYLAIYDTFVPFTLSCVSRSSPINLSTEVGNFV